jgi:hypothetical protein
MNHEIFGFMKISTCICVRNNCKISLMIINTWTTTLARIIYLDFMYQHMLTTRFATYG